MKILSRLYICHKFQTKYPKILCQTNSNVFVLAKWHSDTFLLTYQSTASLRNDWQSDSIPTPTPPNPGRPHPGFVRFRAQGSLELLLEHIALLIFCLFREMANLNCTYYEIIIKPTSLPKKKAENNWVKLQKLSSTQKV